MKKILLSTSISIALLLFFPFRFIDSHTVQAATINGLCLTDREFTDASAMTLAAIRTWLNARGGYLKGTNPDGSPFTFTDVDGDPTDPAKEIYEAATKVPYFDTITKQYLPAMNPRVLLATLYKEKPSAFTLSGRPTDATLTNLAGLKINSPSARDQIRKAGAQLRRNFYARLSVCEQTNNSWQIETPRQTGEPSPGDERDESGNTISVTPENKVVAALYSYTPWAGPVFGGGRSRLDNNPDAFKGRGGNGYFCELWKQFGWETLPGSLAIAPQNPRLICTFLGGDPSPPRCVSLNASGGTPPYTWSTTKGVLSATTGRNVQLRPPANSGSALGGTAYSVSRLRMPLAGLLCI